MNSSLVSSFLPLSPAMLHILLALAAEERHGYAIMQEISQHSQGQYKIGPGTLYDNLQKMMDQGLVEEARGAGRGEDSRRRYYRLTRLGKGVLTAEVDRLGRRFADSQDALAASLGAKVMTRRLYRLIVWLHPPAFAHRFGEEMLSIFDEGNDGFAISLLFDGVVSFGRQWLLRTDSWKVLLALAGAFLQVWVFGVSSKGPQSWARNTQAITPYVQQLMLATLGLLCGLFVLVLTLTLWSMRIRRKTHTSSKMRQSRLAG